MALVTQREATAGPVGRFLLRLDTLHADVAPLHRLVPQPRRPAAIEVVAVQAAAVAAFPPSLARGEPVEVPAATTIAEWRAAIGDAMAAAASLRMRARTGWPATPAMSWRCSQQPSGW